MKINGSGISAGSRSHQVATTMFPPKFDGSNKKCDIASSQYIQYIYIMNMSDYVCTHIKWVRLKT